MDMFITNLCNGAVHLFNFFIYLQNRNYNSQKPTKKHQFILIVVLVLMLQQCNEKISSVQQHGHAKAVASPC